MFKLKRGYFYAAILLIISIGFAIPGCGGSNNGTLPVTNPNPTINSNPFSVNSTPTPALTNINLSGYIYGNNITTDEGETVPNITVIDVPASKADSSGNEPFTTQVLNSLKSDYPEDWARPEVQELYAQLDKTLSESKPLPEYNIQAQVSSVYSDTTIPVGSDGHFDNTVLTGAADNTIKLGVTLGEDSYTEVETLPSSGNINSSDATTAVLKSCPEKIFAFPGEIVIFKVQAEPGINLKSAGLKFTLENPSIGCLTQPVYLCIFGKNKYQTSYGCLYVKKGLDTPVSTNITATTNTGLSIKIFTEVIKKCSSISGTVYTGGMPLVKGFVYSLGPKACCKLDSNGGYTLPKVFRGHGRAVIAIWWTSENGQKIRHREERVIDFFDSDLTGFNFGVPPPPTATPTFPPPTDKYYDIVTEKIIAQKVKWQQELGWKEGLKKTADWLNGQVPEVPVPTEIAEAIQEAKIDEIDPYIMWYYFRSGLEEYIEEPKPADLTDEDMLKEIGISAQADTTMITGSGAPVYTINDPNVLMIGPAAFENRWNRKQLFYGLEEDFTRKKFKTTVKGIMNYQVKNLKYPDGTSCTIKDPENSDTDLSAQVEFTEPTYQEGEFKYLVTCKIRPGSPASYLNPFPEDFEHLDDYDVIFVRGHGNSESIMTCPYYDDGDDNPYNSSLEKWLTNNKGKYCIGHAFFSPVYDFAGFEPSEKEALYYKIITLKREFFANQDFEGKLLYFNICEGKLYCYGYNISHTPYGPVITWDYNDETFKNAQVFITPTLTDGFNVDDELAYKFFSYMLGIDPTDPNRKKIQAKSAVDAYWTVINQSDLKLQALVQMGYGTQIYTQDGKYNNTYLANEPTIEVTKTKK